MFGLFFPAVIAAISLPNPQPTLPPLIGNVYSRGKCTDGQRTLLRTLPLLMRNDNTIARSVVRLANVDSTNDATTQFAVNRTRLDSEAIFKNLEDAKKQLTTLHALAAGSANPDQSRRFSEVADSLDTIVAQQNAVADQLNGYADTADMSLLYTGSETEQKMAAATGPSENSYLNTLQRTNQAQHPSMALSDIGALTTNVFRDIQTLRGQLAQSEALTTQQVREVVKTCAPKRKP
ncbi:MAG: hypothetical protein JO018_05335 [Candidatus Eremiobacteraeota bacterium]|nr:hypothetical protein [Candidatus Eremiobacteraeota bacterium]MBV9403137.1 hypothetical protein [Candidatus Eremiobacteraeota bacterium]MBV9972079.1 hypothetical protein [Candidatus Eremiobacteraeota bacterium]